MKEDVWGWAEIELTVAHAVPVWAVVEGWTEEERQRLLDGDPDARDELEQQVIDMALLRGSVEAINRFKTDINPKEIA